MTDLCLLPSACHDGIGTPNYIAFAAQYLACTPPCQRFACCLAGYCREAAREALTGGRTGEVLSGESNVVHAQGLMTTRGGEGPLDDARVPVASGIARRRAHLE